MGEETTSKSHGSVCRWGCCASALHLVKGWRRGASRKKTLRSSYAGGAEAVGGEADRLAGRPGKVEWLADSASENKRSSSQVQADEWRRPDEATEDVEFQAPTPLPPPYSATLMKYFLFYFIASTSYVCPLEGGENILHGNARYMEKDAPLLGRYEFYIKCIDEGQFILFGEIGEALVSKQVLSECKEFMLMHLVQHACHTHGLSSYKCFWTAGHRTYAAYCFGSDKNRRFKV